MSVLFWIIAIILGIWALGTIFCWATIAQFENASQWGKFCKSLTWPFMLFD